jgi:hypothetical protein
LIPDDFRDKFIEQFEKDGTEYDHDANYDGHMWLLVADYIEYLSSPKEAQEKWFEQN